MLRRLIGENITLSYECPAATLWVEADPNLLGQVVVNLVVNARDAMPRGGHLKLVTDLVTVAPGEQSHGSDAYAGRFVRIVVSDDGCGMSRHFIDKMLFRPFSSTKKRGMGIGLFQSKMIVEAHQGKIEVESEEGKGATFRVILPV
jgi:signal transduction histidine kinase